MAEEKDPTRYQVDWEDHISRRRERFVHWRAANTLFEQLEVTPAVRWVLYTNDGPDRHPEGYRLLRYRDFGFAPLDFRDEPVAKP